MSHVDYPHVDYPHVGYQPYNQRAAPQITNMRGPFGVYKPDPTPDPNPNPNEVTNTVNPSSIPGSTLKNCSNPNPNPNPNRYYPRLGLHTADRCVETIRQVVLSSDLS